jgi:hypothetical protein
MAKITISGGMNDLEPLWPISEFCCGLPDYTICLLLNDSCPIFHIFLCLYSPLRGPVFFDSSYRRAKKNPVNPRSSE